MTENTKFLSGTELMSFGRVKWASLLVQQDNTTQKWELKASLGTDSSSTEISLETLLQLLRKLEGILKKQIECDSKSPKSSQSSTNSEFQANQSISPFQSELLSPDFARLWLAVGPKSHDTLTQGRLRGFLKSRELQECLLSYISSLEE